MLLVCEVLPLSPKQLILSKATRCDPATFRAVAATVQDGALKDSKFKVQAMKALMSYHSDWLRLGTEIILGRRVAGSTSSALLYGLITQCESAATCANCTVYLHASYNNTW